MKITAFVILMLVVLVISFFVPKKKRRRRYGKKIFSNSSDGIIGRPILSAPECAFYKQLCRSLPQYLVFPQVAANAILEVDNTLSRSTKMSRRNQYGQWHIDFTVCEPESLDIVGLVEFDGKQHNAKDDAWRDEVMERGGYKVHRFRANKQYSDSEIAAAFSHTPSTVPVLSAPLSTDTQF